MKIDEKWKSKVLNFSFIQMKEKAVSFFPHPIRFRDQAELANEIAASFMCMENESSRWIKKNGKNNCILFWFRSFLHFPFSCYHRINVKKRYLWCAYNNIESIAETIKWFHFEFILIWLFSVWVHCYTALHQNPVQSCKSPDISKKSSTKILQQH